ncbi:Vacuolar fusion protein CCZ1 [Phytophthora citrophthora]|uniref:Vacuolar fusion protein CCZ1 n=1 Tax=Phytophthora citrophthora TaxID=4793 RepID=A0AAD9GQC2_9STRA|nr:Vacuolar fusion protein CCZ1 [Phytophthora citrophthora]
MQDGDVLLLWHEALGSDDEQAGEDELLARVLYSQESNRDDKGLLQSLHLVQGLLTFVRMLRRSREEEKVKKFNPIDWKPEWASVTLSRRRFFILEVEPQIFMALVRITWSIMYPFPVVDWACTPQLKLYGIIVSSKTHRFGYEALLREMHGMFRLFFGSIDSNLRMLPSADLDNSEITKKYTDGMDLLLDIAAMRKRLRKLLLAIDFHAHNHPNEGDTKDEDNVMKQLQEDKLAVEEELGALVARSPAVILQNKCSGFFPTLLQALDARGTSGLSELQGLGYFPMDQPTFLALQTFVNGFHTEWKLSDGCNKADSSALFFKGNLLWSSMETPTLQLLYKFLRLREERGMTVIQSDEAEALYDDVAMSTDESELWMRDEYEDTFLPVWSSKVSYTECDAVSRTDNGPSHCRKAARSLHKQHPVSLSTFTSEAPSSSGGSVSLLASSPTPRSMTTAESSPFGSPSHSPASSAHFGGPRSNGASPARSGSAIKSRARSVSFRNAGLLLKNGCFLKLLHANRGNLSDSAWDPVWSPLIFPIDDVSAPSEEKVIKHRIVIWHEVDLTMLILFRLDGTEQDSLSTDATQKSLKAATLERLEDYLEGQQRFQSLAQLILTRYNAFFAPEKSAPKLHPLPPFLYINRINLAFRMQHVPRLLKSKDDDLFPVPVKLLPHYFPASTLALVNELHAELHKSSSSGNREICVRTRYAGWILAKKSETSHRELFAADTAARPVWERSILAIFEFQNQIKQALESKLQSVIYLPRMEVLDARVDGPVKYYSRSNEVCLPVRTHSLCDENRRQALFICSFRQMIENNGGTVAEWFAKTPLASPIDLEKLTTQKCMSYLTSMEQRGVTGTSTFGIMRSAMKSVGLMILAEVERMKEGLTEKFESALKRHINGPVMTMEAMEMAFEAVLARSSLCCGEQHASEQSCLTHSNTQLDAQAPPYSVLHMWNGSFHRVPKAFQLPSGTVRTVWQQWCACQPPLRLLTMVDMATRPMKELQRLMRHVESFLSGDEVCQAYSSTDSAGILFTQIINRFVFPTSSGKGRERRLNELLWKTLAPKNILAITIVFGHVV